MDVDAALITKAVISMAGSLRLRVVAEGVEVSNQLNILKDLGCEFGQGFLFSPALDAAHASRFFEPESVQLALT